MLTSPLPDALRARIAELKAARERHAQEAQRTDFGYATAIGELERLLGHIETPPPEIDLSALQEDIANATAAPGT